MAERPAATIAIPTRGRAAYLSQTLASIMPEARSQSAEVLVVCDGPDEAAVRAATAHGARPVLLPVARGANAARNAAAREMASDLLVLVDDDVEAPAGWLAALLDGVEGSPDVDVFGGPIRPRLEGRGIRACGREAAPITSLDLGPRDRDAPFVWSANMAIRRRALYATGPFDETIHGRGEEEEWQRRYLGRGGRVRYVAAAGVVHRRRPEDATLRPLARSSYHLGRSARRYDVRKGTAPGLPGELRILAGCLWHAVRRRCTVGLVLAAHSAGRLREWVSPQPPVAAEAAPVDDFLSGTSGQVYGLRAGARATLADAAADVILRMQRRRLRRAAAAWPRRRVLVVAVERADEPNLLAQARQEIGNSRHAVTWASGEVGGRGKFENLNRLLAGRELEQFDWVLALDDDVALPAGFLDVFLFLAESFSLQLAQPAHRWHSHAAWPVTRRRRGSLVRETAYVEIGPVTGFHASTFSTLLPFPPLRFGWGLDLHWAALARERGWRIGVVDATPIRHGLRRIASNYLREDAVAEARSFLAERPYVPASEANRTLDVHRSWR